MAGISSLSPTEINKVSKNFDYHDNPIQVKHIATDYVPELLEDINTFFHGKRIPTEQELKRYTYEDNEAYPPEKLYEEDPAVEEYDEDDISEELPDEDEPTTDVTDRVERLEQLKAQK